MKFSIIIPAKNEERTFKKITRQYQSIKIPYPHEIIVSDNGSTDTTRELAKAFAGTVLSFPGDHAPTIGAVRNRGAKAAHGELLFFFDSGVVFQDINAFLERAIEVFEDPKVVGATAPLGIYPEEETLVDRFWHTLFNGSIRLYNALGWGAAIGKVHLIRASAFKQTGGYDERFAAGEDNELFSRLARIGKTVFISDLEAYYSPRRFRVQGYVRTVFFWMMNLIYVRLFKRPFTSTWKRIG